MLRIDDIDVGMRLTVLRGSDFYQELPNGDGTDRTVVANDKSYAGAVLEVQAISLPFIAFKELVTKEGCRLTADKTFSLDSREILFQKLRPEFLKAMLGEEEKKTSP